MFVILVSIVLITTVLCYYFNIFCILINSIGFTFGNPNAFVPRGEGWDTGMKKWKINQNTPDIFKIGV